MRRPSRLRSLSSVGLLSPFLLLACIPDGDSDDATADAGRQEDGGTDTDAGTVELTQFARDMLEAHNAARAAAQPTPSPALEPLTWDPTVEETARKWVEQCQFKHNDDRGNAGENIAAATPDYLNAKAVVKGWVDEAADYDYSKNTCKAGEQCGHYTQVVWRNTRRLGCATKRCTVNSPFSGASTWDFWVCNYAPPGNYVGQRPY